MAPGGFNLALGDCLKGAPKDFRRKSAVDTTNGCHAGDERIEIDDEGPPGKPFGQVLDQRGYAVVHQQDKHQFGHATEDSGVDIGQHTGTAGSRQLTPGAEEPQQDGDDHGQQTDQNRQSGALEQHPAITIKIHT